MPEGPSIVILKEQVQQFTGRTVRAVSGNSTENIQRAAGKEVIAFKSWGKHFLICFDDFTIRIHLMLFGTYRINEEKDTTPRMHLRFDNGYINFYTCSVKIIEDDLDKIYDWSSDIMSDSWNAMATLKKLKSSPGTLLCDALLDQHIFSGSGNIIKNEVLYREKLHPLNTIASLPEEKLSELVHETRIYAFDFLRWKKEFTLRQHWLAHTRKICIRCNLPLLKSYLGKTKRRTYYCENCQRLYK
ncbi:MAG TPA: DNA-formamidopyrimidine glycosylase family protein [Edaphocola sp.]|nr:DNA-formamidopyrimidine glycosylase family protein [Edaphocola sp.]